MQNSIQQRNVQIRHTCRYQCQCTWLANTLCNSHVLIQRFPIMFIMSKGTQDSCARTVSQCIFSTYSGIPDNWTSDWFTNSNHDQMQWQERCVGAWWYSCGMRWFSSLSVESNINTYVLWRTVHLDSVHLLNYKIIELQLFWSWILLPYSGKTGWNRAEGKPVPIPRWSWNVMPTDSVLRKCHLQVGEFFSSISRNRLQ